MAAPALPFYGHRQVQAPHLAALASQGIVFDRAYCNSPICAPSRFSMMTGRLPSRIGVYDNGSEFPSAIPTIAHYLGRAGYSTTLCGKMHFVGPDQLHGYEERLITEIYPADFIWTPDWRLGPQSRPSGLSMRPVLEAGICKRSLQIDYDEQVAFLAEQKLFDIARYDTDRPFFLTVSFTHPHSPYTVQQQF
ncbi:MAG: sulfatase-like hydrolase/transferase, partial [Betaproteobacteria bacterium]